MTAAPDLTPTALEPEPRRFRQVLGHFCTGVTVITVCDEDGPAGFACQSFAAVSLVPPLPHHHGRLIIGQQPRQGAIRLAGTTSRSVGGPRPLSA
jgi:hypothetical protein